MSGRSPVQFSPYRQIFVVCLCQSVLQNGPPSRQLTLMDMEFTPDGARLYTAKRELSKKLSKNSVICNSNKSPTRCSNFPFYYPDVYLQLNMFRAFSRPSSGAQWLQWQPLVLPSYRGDSRAVFVVGPAGRPDHEHNTAITTIRRWNQRLPLQSLSSWRWTGKRPKHVEL